MKKPFFKDVVYIVDDADNCDIIAGYDVVDLGDKDDLPLKDGDYVAVYAATGRPDSWQDYCMVRRTMRLARKMLTRTPNPHAR
jgi:hypothetical protein